MPDFTGTILDASKNWPETKSRTFRFTNRRPTEIFFMINERPDMMIGGKNLRSIINCLILNTYTKDLYVNAVPIRDEDGIDSITLKEYVDEVMKAKEEIKNNPEIFDPKMLLNYEQHGFCS